MADRVRPYLFYDVAVSICSTCYRKVEAKIVFEDDAVYMLKRCPEHGAERVLMADDVEYYRRCREVFIKPPEMPQRYNTPVQWGCPYDCGLCPDHEQHSCLSLIEITDHCNLQCPICYAEAAPSRPRVRTLDQIAAHARRGRAQRGRAGRRADLRRRADDPPDFFAVLDMAKAAPIRHLMVNTNGIAHRAGRGVRRSGWPATCRTSRSTCSSTRSSATRCMALRGADLRGVREQALERLNRQGISTTLVVTLKKGLNDDEIGRIIDFALSSPACAA